MGQQWPQDDTGATQELKNHCHLQTYLKLRLSQETTASVLNNLFREDGKSHLTMLPTKSRSHRVTMLSCGQRSGKKPSCRASCSGLMTSAALLVTRSPPQVWERSGFLQIVVSPLSQRDWDSALSRRTGGSQDTCVSKR